MTTLYGIPNCDSVKKAKKWLEANQIPYTFHDFRKNGLDKAKVTAWLSQIDMNILLNKRGTSYRQLPDEIKNNINENNITDLLVDNSTLIKRPVLEFADQVVVGFKADDYQTRLK